MRRGESSLVGGMTGEPTVKRSNVEAPAMVNVQSKGDAERWLQLRLSLLGAHILVRCRHKSCLDGIALHFSPHITEKNCTPDVTVDCDWEEAGRYLFRTRPGEKTGVPLDGVKVHHQGNLSETDWIPLSPPLPPFDLPPFRDRFVGLHAAAVKSPGGRGALLIGERGSGKSTLAMKLASERGCEFLTDEVVCIHRRTLIVEPFAIAVGLKRDPADPGTGKLLVAADKLVPAVARAPAQVSYTIFLSPRAGGTPPGPPVLERVAPHVVFRNLLAHHLDVGSSMDESLVTLLNMAENTAGAQLSYQTFEDLLRSDELIMEFIES
ncbi:MAG: hypothetical protein M3416_01555 [Acidobacteriota bacterium]|nr:hypothetical protein [Acidobacteriota bacterium]